MTKIAYIILAHKAPQQLTRLISRLNTPEASFFVHVDRRTKASVFAQFGAELARFPNVYLLKRRVTRWGEFGIVQATLDGIAEVFRRQLPVDYVVYLTGQDYPIKPNSFIDSFLEQSEGRSYVDFDPVPSKKWPQAANRLRSWHVRLPGRTLLLPRRQAGPEMLRKPRKWPVLALSWCLPKSRKPLSGYRPFTGSAHWVLSRACAQFVNDAVRSRPAFVKYFKYVCCADEVFFQTLLLNSHLAERIVSSDLHYIDWSKGGAHPEVLTADDLPGLAASPALFARKFDMASDGAILQLIDETLLHVASADPLGSPRG